MVGGEAFTLRSMCVIWSLPSIQHYRFLLRFEFAGAQRKEFSLQNTPHC